MTRPRFVGAGALLALMLLGGCSQPPGAEQSPGFVSLVPITFAEWQRKLAGYQGDLVVVDFWASWCAPLIKGFADGIIC